MPDSYKKIEEYAELPQATDATLLLSSQNGTTYSVTAETISNYVHESDTEISDLPVGTEFHDSDYIPVDQSGTQKRISGQVLLDYVDEEVEAQIAPVAQNAVNAAVADAMTTNWIPTALSNIIASSETSFTATRNYTAKELIIVNNQLYKVTANIASGGAITVGTNVTATTLSDIIKTLI